MRIRERARKVRQLAALAINVGAQFVEGTVCWVHPKEVSQTVRCEREWVSFSGDYAAKPKDTDRQHSRILELALARNEWLVYQQSNRRPTYSDTSK